MDAWTTVNKKTLYTSALDDNESTEYITANTSSKTAAWNKDTELSCYFKLCIEFWHQC